MRERAFKAVPTLFRGIEFKSRLEARFAKLLTDAEFGFIYEPARWEGGYMPDFLIPELRLYVEVKPRAFAGELELFKEEIEGSALPWVWVDSTERGGWSILQYNPAFHRLIPSNVVLMPFAGTMKFARNQKGEQKLFFEAYVSYPGLQ